MLLGQTAPNQTETKPAPAAEEKPEVSPTSGGAAVDPRSYRIGAEDVLLLRIWREPDLSGLFTVRPDGKINLMLVGELDAAERTPVELEAQIAKAYEKVLKNPLVTLQVQRVESKRYYISGEVNRTGAFPLIRPITVLEALTMAGGIREFGNAKKIVIMRGKERIKFNYAEVIKGKKLEQNIALEPGDHVVVP
ncbi:polysaccharide biosynthesis/export family protein [Bryobacter aggregatus]|uniref:polysaccharide biosynthesis/export family protein n=1 Tax=Bryobacter aggregatus TaxID=360054 RepID=UPI00138DEE2F|nr:polysaccharide biosynthesis/export family protein [Bryobacter aggregatus]